MPLELSRIIPAHKKTIRARWCKRDYHRMSTKFRDARARNIANLNRCYWCKRPHEDGELMALAAFAKIGNRTLCQNCADELIGEGSNDGQGI